MPTCCLPRLAPLNIASAGLELGHDYLRSCLAYELLAQRITAARAAAIIESQFQAADLMVDLASRSYPQRHAPTSKEFIAGVFPPSGRRPPCLAYRLAGGDMNSRYDTNATMWR